MLPAMDDQKAPFAPVETTSNSSASAVNGAENGRAALEQTSPRSAVALGTGQTDRGTRARYDKVDDAVFKPNEDVIHPPTRFPSATTITSAESGVGTDDLEMGNGAGSMALQGLSTSMTGPSQTSSLVPKAEPANDAPGSPTRTDMLIGEQNEHAGRGTKLQRVEHPDGSSRTETAVAKEDRAYIADSALPQTKLEVLSNQGVQFIIILVISVFILAITVATYILENTKVADRIPEVLAIEGAMMVLASAILLFLLISFPQRIIARRCRKERVLPQQVLIIILIIYQALVPNYGLVNTSLYWADYKRAISRAQNVTLFGDQVYIYMMIENDDNSNTSGQISIALLFFFWASMLRIAGYYSLSIELRLKTLSSRAGKKPRPRTLIIDASGKRRGKSGDPTNEDGDEILTSDSDDDMFDESGSDTDDKEEDDDEDDADGDTFFLLERSRNSRMDAHMLGTTRMPERHQSQTNPEKDVENEAGAAVMEKEKRLSPLRFRMQRLWSVVSGSISRFWKSVETRSKQMSLCSCYYVFCCFMCCSYARCASRTSIRGVLRLGMAWKFLVGLLIYTIFFALLEEVFNFNCSLVPFVGMLSVLRVCTTSDENGDLYCSMEVYPTAFRRAIGVTVLFALEISIFWYIGRTSKRVHQRIAAIPYALNRSNYLSVTFTQATISLFWTLIFLLGVLETCVPSVSVNIQRPMVNLTADGLLDSVYLETDPLYMVGITSSAVTFSCLGVCFTAWVLIMAYAWLPADSTRIRGWFLGLPSSSGPMTGIATQEAHNPSHQHVLNPFDMIKSESLEIILERYFDENPVLISRERRFRKVFMQQLSSAPKPKLRKSQMMLLQATGISSRILFENPVPEPPTPMTAGTVNEADGEENRLESSETRQVYADSAVSLASNRSSRLRTIQRQLLSHVCVIETEIALFNFAALAYKVGTEAWATPPPEQSELVASAPEYKLLRHIVDEKLDTHVIVAKSADRIIISFRGTVSSLNVDTDFDWKLERYDQACEVEPLPSATPRERFWSEKEPTVHRGFQIAYAGVRETLHELIDPLISPRIGPDGRLRQRRAVLCSGHSLGGALAVICAFDFACYLDSVLSDSERPAVGCTTFGCPRIGSYSFLMRYRRMVPSTKRFVLASDIIPKTPPRLFKGKYGGYHHIGTEFLLDLNGNLLISPHMVERAILHGLRSVKSRMHFASLYTLALALWCSRMKIEPDLWVVHITDTLKYAKADILSRHEELFRASYNIFNREGVIYDLNVAPRRNIGIQVDPEEVSEHDEELKPFMPRHRSAPVRLSSTEATRLDQALTFAISTHGERDPSTLTLDQLRSLRILVKATAERRPHL